MRLFPRLIAEEVGEEWGGRIRSLAPEVALDVYWNVLEFWNVLEAAKGRRQLEPDELRQANDVLTHR